MDNYNIAEDIAKINYIFEFQEKMSCQYVLETEDTKAIKHLLLDYERVSKELKKYQNMYQTEHAIHMVRNEQLARKENAVLKAQELENKNKELNWLLQKNLNKSKGNSNDLAKINQEIQRKNNIIDKMAEYMAKNDIDEGVCANTEHCKYDDKFRCKDCVIEYFEGEVDNYMYDITWCANSEKCDRADCKRRLDRMPQNLNRLYHSFADFYEDGKECEYYWQEKRK